MNADSLDRLLAGSVQRLVVGRLCATSVSLLPGVKTPFVMLGHEEARHILEKHPDIGIPELLLIPDAVARGMIIYEAARERRFVAVYQGPTIRYAVSMKLACGGHEAWVSTMHIARKRMTRRYLDRGGVMVRRHL